MQKTNQQSGDCNDNDANINPETIWLLDVDGDGYHEKLYIALPSCAAPQDGRNYINNSKGQDCNDNDATYNPETVWVKDADGDGYYIGEPYTGCFFIFQPGYVQKTNQQLGDCDDGNAAIHCQFNIMLMEIKMVMVPQRWLCFAQPLRLWDIQPIIRIAMTMYSNASGQATLTVSQVNLIIQ